MNYANRKAVIFGCKELKLLAEEKQFFEKEQPWGFILFARNCETPEQIKALCDQLRATVNDPHAPILIDQEGGRVARLKPPLWPARPPMDRFGKLYEINGEEGAQSAHLGARLLAADLASVGVNVNCVPVLDVPQPDAHDIIGDRALSLEPEKVALLAKEVIKGSIEGGVLPIIKHIPGHGRALSDSHLELPVVTASKEELRAVDFVPFKAHGDAPMAMTAHVVYEAFDKEAPATLSKTMIEDVIRQELGFSGLLMTDDLSMKALSGSFAERCQRSIEAGCDILLHCNGEMGEMLEIAENTPLLAGKALERADKVRDCLKLPGSFDRETAETRFAQLLNPVMA